MSFSEDAKILFGYTRRCVLVYRTEPQDLKVKAERLAHVVPKVMCLQLLCVGSPGASYVFHGFENCMLDIVLHV